MTFSGANNFMEANCRAMHPPVAIKESGDVAHARSLGSMAVAHFNRWARTGRRG